MAENKVNRDNYIVIQGWMVTELGLKGSELIVYALIYGFSQTENQVFSGSLQYLADWTNCTKQGVIKTLKSLIEKGYIAKNEKLINSVKFCEYYATKFNRVLNKIEYPVKQSLPNNIGNNIENNIVIPTTTAADGEAEEENENELKLIGGKLGKGVVMMTDAQFGHLCQILSKVELDTYIEKLADFILGCIKNNGTPPTIKSHYKKILEWIEEDRKL